MDPVIEERLKGISEKEKLEIIEQWLLDMVENSRSGEVRVNVGRGHVTLSRNGDWYHSDGSCYPNHIESDPECDCGCRDGW